MAHQAAPIRRIILGTHGHATKLTGNAQKVNISSHVESMLARPSWSVKSLLPKPESIQAGHISKERLQHLLKLSALPSPKSEAEEQRLLNTLESQIHFVKEVQKIDTTGVEPLVAIRDETAEAIQEQVISLEILRPYLEKEKKVGGNGTIRRQKPAETIRDSGWNPFDMGDGKDTRKKNKFFFVKKEKSK